jgi:lipoprotein-anchoring transpeptidase ErfK/SrfK
MRHLRCHSLPLVAVLVGCKLSPGSGSKDDAAAAGSASSASPAARSAPLSSLAVDHEELDTKPPDDAPRLAATVIATTIYRRADTESSRLGYIRLGGVVRRDKESVPGKGCETEWYRVYPMGFVCTDEATVDLEDPVVRASRVRPDTSKPLPYRYGFVRATAPQYLRIPTKAEQLKSEFKLEEHLQWFKDHQSEVQTVVLGANDVPLDLRGIAAPGLRHPEGFRVSTELSRAELFGGTPHAAIPWWLQGGRRIPNVSGFEVPDYAVFADRVRRKTGLSFVGAFSAEDEGLRRRFGITVDLRLIPTTKVKPDTGSPFHGIELRSGMQMPFAFIVKRNSQAWRLIKGRDDARPAGSVPRRAVVPLSGKARIKAGRRFYQTRKDKTRWVQASDIGVVVRPRRMPEAAQRGEKWMDISLRQQTLVLYEGRRPWYATLVSTGRDRLGDPATSLATPQGTFRLRSKHLAAAMDSQENTGLSGGQRRRIQAHSPDAQATIERLQSAAKQGQKLSEDDQRRLLNIRKGRDPEYGVTMRRGAQNFELRDVPWIQYFASGYAIHGAYWHDVFGIPRSHGCVNLAPIDARVVFMWTDPPLPAGWHGMNIRKRMGQGTVVVIHE